MTKKAAILFLILIMLILPAAVCADTAVPTVTLPPGTLPDRCNGNHNWVTTVVQPATCTQQGYSSSYCSRCREQKRDVIPALGHDYVKVNEVPATCKNPGSATWRCSRCGSTKTEETKALGHQYGDPKVDIPPTCTEKGRSVRVCKRNESHVWYGELEALGHDFGPWLTVNGVRSRTCSRCGLTETEPVTSTMDLPPTEPDKPVSKVLPAVMPAISLETAETKAVPYQENDVIQVKFVLTNIGPVHVSITELNMEGGNIVIDPYYIAIGLDPGQSAEGSLEIAVSAGDASGYKDWLYRYFSVKCKSDEDVPCTASCIVIVPKLKNGASLLLIAEDTTGLTASQGSTYPVRLWCFNNGTIPLRDLNLQSLDSFMIGVAQDTFDGLDSDRHLDVGACKKFNLMLYVRPEDASDGIAWREVMADAAREDNDGPVGDTVTVAVVVDTMMTGPEPPVPDPITPEPITPEPITPEPITPEPPTPVPPTPEPPAPPVPPDPDPVIPEEGEAELKLTVTLAEGTPDEVEPGYPLTFEWTLENTGKVPVFYGSLLMSAAVPHEDADDPNFGLGKTAVDTQASVQMLPGQALQGSFGFPVEDTTDGDMVSFFFQALGVKADGKHVKSNVELSFIILKEKAVTLVKEITTHPKNGSYYREGEEIGYQITATNDTRSWVDNVFITDPLSGSSDPLASAGTLKQGESLTASFSYYVTGEDVGNGQVINTAVCDYTYRRIPRQVTATVKASTGKPVTADYCVPTLLGSGEGTAEIGLKLCEAHLARVSRARALMSASPENGPEAAALLTDAVHDLYADLYAKTGDSVFFEEQAAFDVLMQNLSAFRAAKDPAGAAAGYAGVIEALTEKCVNLCYEAHTAPSDRKDSVFSRETAFLSEEGGAMCVRTFAETPDGALIHENLCGQHRNTASFLQNAALTARTAGNRASLFRSAASIWMTETELLIQQAGLAGGKEAETLSVLKASLNGYLRARETSLARLYPDRPDIAAEVLMSETRAWMMIICAGIR